MATLAMRGVRKEYGKVAALTGLVTGWKGQGPVDLPGGLAATRRCATLHLEPRAGPLE